MKKFQKLFTLLTLFVTIFSSISNLTTVFAVDTQKTTVAVHKILMSETDFNKFNHDTAQAVQEYDGRVINNIQQYFGASATEVKGVNFKVYKQDATGDKTGAELGIISDTEKYKLVADYTGGVTTGDNGIAEFTLENGVYIFVEDKVASPYYSSPDGKELTGMKAVPFKLELPVTKPDGNGYFDTNEKLHVYPKNTESKPEITKTFEDGTKTLKEYEIGKTIPYSVSTTVPKDAAYKTFVWEDTMLTGLDFTLGSLVITSTQLGTLVQGTDYTLTETKRGFIATLTTGGLTKLENEAKKGTVDFTLKYNATLNDSAVVDSEIPNTIKLHYGNRPNEISEPKSTTPKNGEIEVVKTWAEGVTKVNVTFSVYEKETGVKAGTVTLNAGETSVKFTGLKAGVEYIVLEETAVNGSLPSYAVTEQGKISVENKKNPNPTPVTPEEPKVITYGKRFVKTNNETAGSSSLENLGGAEFVVKNQVGEFLALKSADAQAAQVQAYKEKEAAYIQAVKDSAADTADKKAARDAAYEAMNMQWTWVNNQANAFVFVSSADGTFEVNGLEAGTYKLVETKAPEGYALLSGEITFSVARGSWTDATGISGHMQIKNKKVSIPQTGGIGTIVFTVVGLSVMAYAFIAMKRRQSEAEEA